MTSVKSKLKETYWTLTRAMGLGFLHGHEEKYAKQLLNQLLFVIFYPFYALLSIWLLRVNVRFIVALFEGEPYGVIEHIGQCAMDFDSYLKDQLLLGKRVTPVFLCAGRSAANEPLMAHWSRYIIFIRNPWLETFVRPLMSFPKLVDPLGVYGAIRRGPARNVNVQSRWGDRPALLCLSEAETARGEAEMRRMGIPEGAWFVCIHSREGGYIPGAEWQHSFRNSNIADYGEAMRAIVARGGWCVRVGDTSMRPLGPMPGVIDYALSPFKSDWMDIFLAAKCRFFLGNTSGLFGLAGIFGKPSALANMTPLGVVGGVYHTNICIPKILTDAQGQALSFPDIYASEASQFTEAPEFAALNLRHIDNTPDEIAELALEMLDRLAGLDIDQPEDVELQARFHALIRPYHFCWPGPGRIGQRFLRRHKALLDKAGRSDFAPPVIIPKNTI